MVGTRYLVPPQLITHSESAPLGNCTFPLTVPAFNTFSQKVQLYRPNNCTPTSTRVSDKDVYLQRLGNESKYSRRKGTRDADDADSSSLLALCP